MSLADGSRTSFARYRIRISPWLWRLGQVRNSRVWQDKSLIEIVDAVFQPYLPLAKWRWSDDSSAFIAGANPRSYCCQYRESDLDFVRRLLAEEGLSWRMGDTELVIFADSTQPGAVPEDPGSERDGGIRFHGASAVEASDTVQALQSQRRLHASLVTVLGSDYKARQSVTGPLGVCQAGRATCGIEKFMAVGTRSCFLETLLKPSSHAAAATHRR